MRVGHRCIPRSAGATPESAPGRPGVLRAARRPEAGGGDQTAKRSLGEVDFLPIAKEIVLVCCPDNPAVDHVGDTISDTGNVEALKDLLTDEGFLNLLRAEGLATMPRALSSRISGENDG